jgi:SAM-dependent methyltransferase
MAGSYDPQRTTAGGLAAELTRLNAQAALSFEEELRIYRHIGLADADPLLEVGCGPGAVTRRLRTALPDTRIVGLDVDVTLLDHARQAGTTLIAGDATQLPLRDACFGAALVRYVMQHLARPQRLLAELIRVVRPGGVVALVDVDSMLWGLVEPWYPELANINGRMVTAQQDAGGDRLVGRRLTRLLRAAGFVDVAMHPFAMTSDARPLDDFAPLLGPARLAPLLTSGALTLRELAVAADCWRRFRSDPDAWIMLLGFVATGRAPGRRGGAAPHHPQPTSCHPIDSRGPRER